jgi:hypothetical protein
MKITKIEQAQTGFASGSGARPLSSRLDPGAMAAPGAALAQLGNTISDTGQAWLEKEIAIRNQQEVAKAQSHMSTVVDNAREAVKMIPDPRVAEAEFNRIVSAERQRVDKGGVEGLSFTTGSGRRSWQAETSTLIANGAKNVRTTARTLMADTAVADTLRALDQLADDRANAQNQADRNRLEVDMRLRVKNLEAFGYLDPKDAFKTTKSYLSKSDALLIEKQLLEAEKSNDPDMAEDVFSAIQDSSQYENLEGEDRQNLSERALRLADRLERKAQADEDRQERRNKTQIEDNQRKTFRTLAAQIAKHQQDPNQELPSLLQILDAFAANDLSPSQFDKIREQLQSSGDPIIVDKVLVGEFYKEIRNAESEAQLEEIEDRAYNNLNKKFDLDSVEKIRQRINEAKSNTPQARQAKIFGNLLDTVAQAGGILDSILPGAKEKAAVIEAQFEADIADGVSVTEAFRSAVDALQKGQRANLRSLAPPRLGAASGKPLDQWTIEDVRQSREVTKGQFSGKASTLALELFKLRVLENYITNKPSDDDINNQVNQFEGAQDR